MSMTFGQALSTAQQRAGLSDEQIAAQIGCRAMQVYRWKNGRAEPRRHHYDALRRILPDLGQLIDGKAVA